MLRSHLRLQDALGAAERALHSRSAAFHADPGGALSGPIAARAADASEALLQIDLLTQRRWTEAASAWDAGATEVAEAVAAKLDTVKAAQCLSFCADPQMPEGQP